MNSSCLARAEDLGELTFFAAMSWIWIVCRSITARAGIPAMVQMALTLPIVIALSIP